MKIYAHHLDLDDLGEARIKAIKSQTKRDFIYSARYLVNAYKKQNIQALFDNHKAFACIDFLLSFDRYQTITCLLTQVPDSSKPQKLLRGQTVHHLQHNHLQAKNINSLLTNSQEALFKFYGHYFLNAIIDEPLSHTEIKALDIRQQCILEFRTTQHLSQTTFTHLMIAMSKQNIFLNEALAIYQELHQIQWKTWTLFFPEDPAFAILYALQDIFNSGELSSEAHENLEKGLTCWPDFWCLMLCDPVFSTLNPKKNILPHTKECMVINTNTISPTINDEARFELGKLCQINREEIRSLSMDCFFSPIFHFHDTNGNFASYIDKPIPPYSISVGHFSDRTYLQYHTILQTFTEISQYCDDIWFFISSEKDFIDEISVKNKKIGIKRWKSEAYETWIVNYLKRLQTSQEVRFATKQFKQFIRKIRQVEVGIYFHHLKRKYRHRQRRMPAIAGMNATKD